MAEAEQKTGREQLAVFGKDGKIGRVERRVELQEFSFSFHKNLDAVLDVCSLTATTFRVMHRTVYLLGINTAVSQKGLAVDLGLTPQQVNKAWKQLKAAGILIENEAGHVYPNLLLYYRGSPKDLVHGENQKRLRASQRALDYIPGICSIIKEK